MLTDRTGLGEYYSSVCIFLFGVLCLTVDSGYSWGPALLFLAGLILLFRKSQWPRLKAESSVLVAVLALFFGVWVLDVILRGESASGLDRPSRFLAAIVAFFWLLRYPPRQAVFWLCLVVGAFGAAGIAVWERFVEDAARASGYNHPIQFGNLSMMFGLLCLCGAGWAVGQRNRVVWFCLLFTGFLCGFLASILSGSRGGWVSLPFAVLVLYFFYRPWLNKKVMSGIVMAGLVLVAVAYFVPQTGVQDRVMQVYYDVKLHSEGKVNTPVGTRLEMWKAAAVMIAERPFTGWGQPGYEARMEVFADNGVIDRDILQYNHAHNEFLDITAKRGIGGLLSLLSLYFIPVIVFWRTIKGEGLKRRSFAAAGAMVCLSYVGFSLSQSFMSHNSGVMVFAFMLVICASLLFADARESRVQ
ncbi:O-antigen ligase family protein [Marinobacter adhaerens]|uniref:O-antigen ligase family protein n=1 Tax=Marinobacter adhaerens TaxID=1033846 RepID=UPI001E3B8FDF|nr:O-antigen ligase [Marinobacter adhaerens]MCD1648060.1 O-antigen ligase family protein [Marinobacter adhaerens]